MGADDDPAAGLLVGPQSGVEELGAAGVDEGGRAVLQQLSDAQEGGQVLLFCGHHTLQVEHVGQVAGAQAVGKDAAGGVGIADVHVPVDQARRHHHALSVNDPVGGNVGQVRRLAHPDDTAALNQQPAVADDAPLSVHGDDVAGALDFQCSVRHLCLQRTLASIRVSGHYSGRKATETQ